MSARLIPLAVVLALAAACAKSSTGPDSPSGSTLVYQLCANAQALPLVAFQDGAGEWTKVTPSGGAYRFDLQSGKGGVLQVYAAGGGVSVTYGTLAELESFFGAGCVALRNGNGFVNGLGAGETATVSLGWNSSTVSGPGNVPFTAQSPAQTTDLLAVLGTQLSPVAKFVFRRNVDIGSLQPIDFSAAEALTPVQPHLAIVGAGGQAVTFAEWYQSAEKVRTPIFYGASSANLPSSYYAMPASSQSGGDLYELFAYTAPQVDGPVTTRRTLDYYAHGPADRTLTFSALPATGPAVSVAAAAPYPRLAAHFAPQADDKYFLFYLSQAGRSVQIYATTAYLGGATDLVLPDFSGLPGWSDQWVPAAGVVTNWTWYEYRWPGSQPPFTYPVDGWTIQYNSWASTITP